MSALQTTWYLLIVLLLIGYTVLDGFDLGVGFWHLCSRNPATQRTLRAAIAPFWDGNEVWLITAGAGLFAAFPPVYATVFSGMYLPVMLVLPALILRAVGIEFSAHDMSPRAQSAWSLAFGLGSVLPMFIFGVVLGNLLNGLPLDAQGNYTGAVFGLLHPVALLVGAVNVALLAAHGALYLALRVEGEIAQLARHWATRALASTGVLVALTFIVMSVIHPPLLRNFTAVPLLWAFPLFTLGALAVAGIMNHRRQPRIAFAASCTAISTLLLSAFCALFPLMVPDWAHPARTLTAANASASPLSLQVMLIITLIGMPFVMGYTIWVYRVFGGKTREGEGYE